MSWRRLPVAALMSVLLISAMPGTTSAASDQPVLTGDQLSYDNAAAGETPPPHLPTWVGSLTMETTCNPDDTGSFSGLVGTGNANGPYPGTFRIEGTATMTGALIDSLDMSFEIRDLADPSLVVASGTLALDPAAPAPEGTCYRQVDEEEGEDMAIWTAGGLATYSAVVNVGGTPTPEAGYVKWSVRCITNNAEPACDTSEGIGLRFVGSSAPRVVDGQDGTASTAGEATATDAIATSVVNPAGGYVYLQESDLQPDPDESWVYLGREVYIYTELEASVEQPIVLSFMVDASLLTDVDWRALTLLRDGEPAADCTGPDGQAVSDPCVDSRTLDGNGDLTIVVLTSHASTWSVVSPVKAPGYVFSGFQAPVDNPGATNVRNVVKAGQAVPLRWRITNDDGSPVPNATSATVKVSSFSCGLSATADQLEEVATSGSGLRNLGDGYYALNWATLKSYANSCKELTLTVAIGDDAVAGTALFEFRR